MRHIELEETRPIPIRFPNVLYRLRAGRAQAIWQIQISGHLRNGELAVLVVNFVDADWRESDRSVDFVTPDLALGVSLVGVDQHARDDFMAVEGLSICQMCFRLSGVGGSIIPSALG